MVDTPEQQVAAAVETPAEQDGVEPEIVTFDFRHPPRIARDRRTNLEGIFGRFANSMQAYFSSRLRGPADFVLSSVEQATFGEYVFSRTAPCAAVVFELARGGQYHAILDFGTELAFFMLDRLFGGPGESPSLKRPMTHLEQTVIKGIADRTLQMFEHAWRDEQRFEVQYVGFESTPDALSITSRDEPVLVATFEVRSARFAGPVSICIPLPALENYLQERPSQSTRSNVIPEAERVVNRRLLEGALRGANMEVRARFPLFGLRAGSVADLKTGQVIHTGHHLEIPIELIVSGRRRFLGVMGQIHRNIGVRVTAVVEPQQNSSTKSTRGRIL